jgi:hypothetical protein
VRFNSFNLTLPSCALYASRCDGETEALNLTSIWTSTASLSFLGNFGPIIDRSSKMPAVAGGALGSSARAASRGTNDNARLPRLLTSLSCNGMKNPVSIV